MAGSAPAPAQPPVSLSPVIAGASAPGQQIARGLVLAQRAALTVEKDARNKHGGYNYASADSTIAAARRALGEAGLAVHTMRRTFMPSSDGQNGDKTIVVGQLLTTFGLVHESGEVWFYPELPWPVLVAPGKPLDKGQAAAQTTCLAYFLRDLLLLDRGDADDVDARKDEASPGPAIHSATAARQAPAEQKPPAPVGASSTPVAPPAAAQPALVPIPDELLGRLNEQQHAATLKMYPDRMAPQAVIDGIRKKLDAAAPVAQVAQPAPTPAPAGGQPAPATSQSQGAFTLPK